MRCPSSGVATVKKDVSYIAVDGCQLMVGIRPLWKQLRWRMKVQMRYTCWHVAWGLGKYNCEGYGVWKCKIYRSWHAGVQMPTRVQIQNKNLFCKSIRVDLFLVHVHPPYIRRIDSCVISLCLFILSPLTAQTLTWWPYPSMILSLQATHRWSGLRDNLLARPTKRVDIRSGTVKCICVDKTMSSGIKCIKQHVYVFSNFGFRETLIFSPGILNCRSSSMIQSPEGSCNTQQIMKTRCF